MAPKIRPYGALLQDEAAGGGGSVRPSPLKREATSRLLGRIADALQVPKAALYTLPNAITPVRPTDSDGATHDDLEQNCEALLDAYRRIHDPEMRRRLLALVHAAAERS